MMIIKRLQLASKPRKKRAICYINICDLYDDVTKTFNTKALKNIKKKKKKKY